MNPAVAAGGTGVTVNPTNLATPSNYQVWRAQSGGGLYSLQNGTLYMASYQDPNIANALKTNGIDLNSIAAYGDSQIADMNRQQNYNNVVTVNPNDPNFAKYFSPTSATTQMQTVNTAPSLPANQQTIAAAQAAQAQQLAGDQGMNVTQTTTPEGVAAVQKTPLGTTPAQTQTTSGSTQPNSTAGAGVGAVAPTSSYTGTSIVDYLNSVGKASDYASRAQMAQQMGIQNYSGTAAQNTQMLNALRSSGTAPVTTPTGEVGQSGTMGQASGGTSSGGGVLGATDTSTGATDPYAGLDPIAKQVKMYTDASTALGLPTIKQQYDDYSKQSEDLNNELQDKILDVNNNPWLSEGIREKEITNLQNSYATRLDTLTHLMTLTDSLYQQGLAQVDKMTTNANADIAATNALAQKQVDAATALAKDNVVQSVGGRELLINKDTGKTVADLGPTTPSASASAGFSLSAGQTRFDANGNPIASVAPKPTSSTSTAKGSLSSTDFVAQTLANQGLDYNTTIASVPAGRVGVIDNKTGTIGTILPSEYNASIYTYL